MDGELLRKVQLAQLDIAKEIKRICDKNNIDYFMDFGTLLGAVRHKGFIPWDDDMDFGMTRRDFEHFIECAKNDLDSRFFLQTWNSDSGYGLPFAKLRLNNSVYLEEICKDCKCHQGIYVDVFIYDNFPNDKKEQKKLKINLLVLKSIIRFKLGYKLGKDKGKFNYKLIEYYLLKFIGLFFSKDFLIKLYNKYAQKYNKQECNKIFYNDITTNCENLEKEYYMDLCEIPFEDTYFKAPRQFDAVLKNTYGDYMQLPPEDKRESTHGIIEIKL